MDLCLELSPVGHTTNVLTLLPDLWGLKSLCRQLLFPRRFHLILTCLVLGEQTRRPSLNVLYKTHSCADGWARNCLWQDQLPYSSQPFLYPTGWFVAFFLLTDSWGRSVLSIPFQFLIIWERQVNWLCQGLLGLRSLNVFPICFPSKYRLSHRFWQSVFGADVERIQLVYGFDGKEIWVGFFLFVIRECS